MSLNWREHLLSQNCITNVRIRCLLNHWIVFQGFLHCVWTLNSAVTIIPLPTAVCCRVTVKITVLIMTSPYTLTMGFLLNCPCPFQSFLNPNMDRLCAYKRSVRFISFSTHSQYYSNTSTINKLTHVIVQAHFHNINCLAELTKCIFLVIEKEM